LKNTYKVLFAGLIATVTILTVGLINAEAFSFYDESQLNRIPTSLPVYYGIKSSYTAYSTPPSHGVIVAATWATLRPGSYRESGWTVSSSESLRSYYAIDGIRQSPTNPNITSGTQYNFEVSNTNQDFAWDMVAPGILQQTTGPSASTSTIDTGYEMTFGDVTLQKDHFTNKYVYVNNAWNKWSSSYGNIGGAVSSGYYRIGCGTGSEPSWHTQHGTGSAPASCS
jgi:hypothetical protein